MGTVRLHLEHNGTKLDFEGSPEETVKVILDFIVKIYPAFEIVKKLTLTVDLEELMKSMEGIVGFSPEGPVTLIHKEKLGKLSIRDQIALNLVKAYLGSMLKLTKKNSLSVDEFLGAIGGRIGAMAGRLSEMVDEGLVERVGRGEYRVTTYGLKYFSEFVLPKIKQIKSEV